MEMGLFKRKDSEEQAERALAKRIAKHGVFGEARIESMNQTGRNRTNGPASADEYEFRLTLTPADGPHTKVSVRQFMNELTLTELEPGEPVEVLYDPSDPEALIVQKSPKVVFVRNPQQFLDGKSMIAVPVAEAHKYGQFDSNFE